MEITVFSGGTVLCDATHTETSSEETPAISHALAVQGARVIAIGDDALEILNTHEHVTEIDLAGGTLAPAPGDGHAHPLLGGSEQFGPQIRAAQSLDEILAAVAEWKTAHPDAPWIIGASYDATLAPGGLFDAHWLDAVTGDTPAVLRSWDYHTVWVNSAALALGNITAETPDPPLGRIVRREDGSPLGTLQEAAANNFLADVVPAADTHQRIAALSAATELFAAQGTTWVQDAWVEPDDVVHYCEAAIQDRLHTRINLAFRADPMQWREQLTEFVHHRDSIRALNHQRLSGETIKFFVDGIIESHTAALLEPYTDRPDEHGLPNWETAELGAAASAFDAAGFQLHLHAIGDAAIRAALNAIEIATTQNPPRERHHVIAHVSLIDPTDVPRFAELGVIANFEPYWAQCDATMRDLTIPHIGAQREQQQYLIASLAHSGATVTFGSDWPVTTPDWRAALATAITRRSVGDPEAQSWLPNECVDTATAYAAYTTGIARQALSSDRGTLTVGQIADAVWLSANPLTTPPDALPELVVHGTWLAGNAVYLREQPTH